MSGIQQQDFVDGTEALTKDSINDVGPGSILAWWSTTAKEMVAYIVLGVEPKTVSDSTLVRVFPLKKNAHCCIETYTLDTTFDRIVSLGR